MERLVLELAMVVSFSGGLQPGSAVRSVALACTPAMGLRSCVIALRTCTMGLGWQVLGAPAPWGVGCALPPAHGAGSCFSHCVAPCAVGFSYICRALQLQTEHNFLDTLILIIVLVNLLRLCPLGPYV